MCIKTVVVFAPLKPFFETYWLINGKMNKFPYSQSIMSNILPSYSVQHPSEDVDCCVTQLSAWVVSNWCLLEIMFPTTSSILALLFVLLIGRKRTKLFP